MTPKEDKVDWYWTDVHLLTFCLQITVVFLFFYVCSVPAICNKRIEAVYYYVLWIQPLCWRDCFSCRHRKASQWCPENQGIQAYFYSIFIKLRFSEKVKKKNEEIFVSIFTLLSNFKTKLEILKITWWYQTTFRKKSELYGVIFSFGKYKKTSQIPNAWAYSFICPARLLHYFWILVGGQRSNPIVGNSSSN